MALDVKLLGVLIAFIVICSCMCKADAGSFSAIEILYENRQMISDMYAKCPQTDYMQTGKLYIPCGGKQTDRTMQKLYKSDATRDVWIENKKEAFSAFLNFYRVSSRVNSAQYNLVTDSTLVKVLVACLADTTDMSEFVIEQSLDALLTGTAVPSLIDISKRIRNIRHPRLQMHQKYLELIVATQKEKKEADSLLHANPQMPLHFKARLGDTSSEAQLINKFVAAKQYQEKVEYAKMLLFIGTNKSVKIVIKKFNDPVYKLCDGRKSESIWWPILYEFYKRYHDDELFRVDYQYFSIRKRIAGDASPAEQEEQLKSFIQKFTEWAFVKFGVKPERSPQEYVLNEPCVH